MKPVRVLQIITRLIVGGAQETVFHAAELMDLERFQVDVLSGPQTGSEGSLIEEMRSRGIRLTILPELLREVSPLNDLLAVWKMYRFIRANKYEVVHTNSSKAGILGRVAARLAGTPVIVHTVHGWSFHDYMSSALRRTYILLERFTASFTQALVMVTERDIPKGLKEGIGRPDQYVLIRSAIPLDEFDPAKQDRMSVRRSLGIPAEALVLGNVGRFSEQKNPLAWVKIAGWVGRSLPEVRFLLVGDGPLRPQVEAAFKEEHLFERTVLTGLRRDVPALMSAMDVFLLTSLWEGLPRVIPQAQSMGLPVVANRADGTAEAIVHGETGYLGEAGDLQQMASLCIDLLTGPTKRQALGMRGKAFARQEFDVRRMVAQLEALYLDLLHQKNRSIDIQSKYLSEK